MSIVYRNIERKDNLFLAELIRNVFREFGIDRPGTVYFDPTTDDLYKLFRKLPGPLGNSGHFGCDIWMIKDLV